MSQIQITIQETPPVNIDVDIPDVVDVTVQEANPVTVTVAPSITYQGGTSLDSPSFVGSPTAPTAAPGTDTDQLATCAFVQKATTYEHIQQVAQTNWLIQHNMHKYPSYIVIDSTGEEVRGDTRYNSLDQLELVFSAAISGRAYLT